MPIRSEPRVEADQGDVIGSVVAASPQRPRARRARSREKWRAGLDRDVEALVERWLAMVERATGGIARLELRPDHVAREAGGGSRATAGEQVAAHAGPARGHPADGDGHGGGGDGGGGEVDGQGSAELPLHVAERRVGSVHLTGPSTRALAGADLESLAHAATAIETALCLQQARESAAKAQQLLAALKQAHLLIADAPLSDVLDFVAKSIEAYDPSVIAAVVLLDAESGTLHPGAGPSLPEDYLAAIDGVVVGPNVGTCGAAAWSGRMTITEDIETDAKWGVVKPLAAAAGLRRCWSMPITSAEGEVLGTLAFYGTDPGAPRPDQVSFQEDWARVLGIAIERDRATARLVHDARHDGLTGLPNRRAILDELTDVIGEVGAGKPAATLFIDLDGLKTLNDRLGHDGADEVLREVSGRLVEAAPPGAFVGRLGGDEFVMVARDVWTQEEAEHLARVVLEAISQPLPGAAVRMMTASVGVAMIGAGSLDAREVLRRADAAMYDAKRAGGDCYVFSDVPERPVEGRHLALRRDLPGAEHRGELRLEFQPIVDLATGEMVAAEALLRWDHPQLQAISPAEFVPLAEESGAIVPIGAWALRESCDVVARVREETGRQLGLTVNVSARQLAHPGFAWSVRQVLGHAQVPAEQLFLEITETAFVQPGVSITKTFEQLAALGVRVLLDDFGTGFSSLTWLKRVTLAGIKVDRSFVAGVARPGPDRVIVTAMIEMASGLGCTVTAEGVETAEQLDALVALGCHRAQGFHLCRPLPASALPPVLGTTVVPPP